MHQYSEVWVCTSVPYSTALAVDKLESAMQKSMVPFSIVLGGGIKGLPGVSGEPNTEEYGV